MRVGGGLGVLAMARDTYNPGSGGSSVLLVTGPDPVALPEGLSGFTGDLTRAGRDLLVEMPDGTALRLVDYFTHGAPDLVHANEAVLPGAVAERLAGPLAPGQYAQAGGADLGAPIGQVETLEGSAEVQRADGTVVALRVGTEIFANDLVTTGEGSTAALTFLDGTVFTLAADSRMLIDNLIYDPNGGHNASGFNLIQGGFVFIAGAIAPTGNMEVTTPTASMGIRGTTVSVEIRTDEGVTRVQVALNPDPDGGLGRIELFDLQGNLLGTITTTDISWIVSPVEGETRVLERSFAPDSPESALLDTAIRAFQSAITRAQSGSATQTDGSGTPDVILDFGEDGTFDEDIFGDDEGGDALIDLIRDILDGDDSVILPNLAPVAVPIDAGSVAETAAPVVIDLLAGQRDPNGDTLSIADVTVTAGETAVAFTLDGTVVTIDPAQFIGLGTGEQADITIRYSLSDGTLSVENTATLTVTGVNTAPEATPIDAGTVAETADPVVIDLLANATDAEGDTLSLQDVVVTVGEGTASFSLEGGVLTLDPAQFVGLGAEESSEVSISYRISDGENLIDNTATLTVTGVNTAPEVTPIDAGTVAETADRVVIDLLAGATDAEGDTLSVQDVVVTVGEGTATFSLEGGVLTLDPAQFGDLEPGETRSVSIAYRISDGAHLVDAAASLTVEGTNTAPVVADVTIPAATVLAGGGFDASPDFDGWTASTATTGLTSVSFSTAGVDRSGTALSDGDDAVAVLRFSGTASSFGGTGSGPTLTSDLVAVQAGDTLRVTYDLIAGASTGTWDNGGMIAELVDGSGTVVETLFSDAVTVGSSTGLQTLDLTLTQTGTYGVRFTLQSTDGTFGGVVGAELRIGEATLTRVGATESAPYSFDAALLTDGASDPDGGTVALLSVAGTSTAGARVSLAEGRISYDPDGAWDHLAAGETGTDTFTFTVSDGQGGTTTATATSTVAGEGAGAELFAGAPVLDDLITLPDLSGFEAVIVNGFTGVDTAAFTAGPADPFGTVDLRGIEVLDLTNGAADDVVVTLDDLLAMSDEADTRLQALLGDPVDAAGGVYRTILGEAGDTIRLAQTEGVDVGILPDGEGQAGGSYGGHTDVSVWQFTDSGTGEVLARLAIDDDVTTHVVSPT
jgi:VCBS repeat-containing protein